jgi:hypothetical protein
MMTTEYETVWHGAAWREIAPVSAPVTTITRKMRKRVNKMTGKRLEALKRGQAERAARQTAAVQAQILAAIGDGELDVLGIQKQCDRCLGTIRVLVRAMYRSRLLESRNEKVKGSTKYRKLYRRRQTQEIAA